VPETGEDIGDRHGCRKGRKCPHPPGEKGSIDVVKYVDAIFYVDSLYGFEIWLKMHGAEIIHRPRTVSSGCNPTARHPDGLAVEYFEAADS
jgi:hypothetical protein